MHAAIGCIIDAAAWFPTGIPAAVTKLLDRGEAARDPGAKAAVRKEGDALVAEGTWKLDTVIERDGLIELAKANHEKIHLGELMTICSIKYYEKGPSFWVHKGRICYRGDIGKDQDGAAAVYQELDAQPTSIQAANANIARTA